MLKSLLICACLSAIVGYASGEIYFRKGAPHVKLTSGDVLSGSVKFSRDGRPYSSFMGIPYASVPERFAEPQLITGKQWDGVKSFVDDGPMCPQPMYSGLDKDTDPLGQNEDCLSLNVNVPMNNTGKKGYPVVVWIHGGGFLYGGNTLYGPKFFMDEDVIFIGINYRLGIFGFLSTGTPELPGNQGLKDTVVALKWIQENIHNFGGNREKVTIIGESAGGGAVHYLTLSPTAKGLFHRAIVQSGTALALWALESNPRSRAVEVATLLKCPHAGTDPSSITPQEIATCLKEKSVKELNQAQVAIRYAWPMNSLPLFFGPSIEAEVTATSTHTPFLTQSARSIITDNSGKPVNDVPIIFGATEHEGVEIYSNLVLSNPELLKEMNEDWNTVAPGAFFLYKHVGCPQGQEAIATKLKEFYFGDKEISQETEPQLTDMYSDVMAFYATQKAAIETAKRAKKGNVYLYQYAHIPPMPFMSMAMGSEEKVRATKVGHGDDLAFEFDMEVMIPATKTLIEPDSDDEIFSKRLVRLWVSFAKHGEPKYTWGNVARWNPISKQEAEGTVPLKMLRLQNDLKIVEDTSQERIAFWDRIWDEYILKGHSGKDGEAKKTEL